MPKRSEKRVESDGTDIKIGIDAGSFSASISSSGMLTLGIGIAEVELNLKDPNESSINYAFGLYTIDGERDGCTVILRYYIADELVQTETRTIPECDDDDDDDDDDGDDDDDDGSDDDGNTNTPDPRRNVGWYGIGQAVSGGNQILNEVTELFDSNTGELLYYSKHNYRAEAKAQRTLFPSGYRWIVTSTGTLSGYGTWFPPEYAEFSWTYDDLSTTETYYYSNEATYLADKDKPKYKFIAWMRDLADLQILLNKECIKVKSNSTFEEGHVGLNNDYLIYGKLVQSSSMTNESLILDATKPNILDKIKQPPSYKEKPKMDSNCCQMIEEIYEILGIAEMQDKGFIIPNRMIVPNSKGNTKLENYLEILAYQMRQTDHMGIHPFIAQIKDSNEAIAGDQPLGIQFPNGTAAMKYIADTVMESKADAATRLSLLVRLSYASAQITTYLIPIARGIKALSSFFGMPLIERVEKVKLPFDILLGIKPSEGKAGEGTTKSGEQIKAELLKKIDQNTEDTTEDMLPDFMKVGELEVKTQDFRPSTEFDFWAFLKREIGKD